MRDDRLSRRGFLRSSTVLGGAALLRLSAPALGGLAQAACSAAERDAAFVVLAADEAADFAAIAARIIPTTDTPGATEAAVVHFFDQAFADAMQGSLAFARDGLAELNQRQDGARFAALDDAAQDRALQGIETTPFFELMRVMTIFGFFAMASYGGNRDHVGWRLIGFDGHHGAWQYPFGYYDAAVSAETADGDHELS